MTDIVVDSNILVAAFDGSDVWHQRASSLIDECEKKNLGIIHTDCVLNETISVLCRRFQNKQKTALLPEVLDNILSRIPPSAIVWTSGLAELWFSDILELIKAHSGTIGFNDALIAQFMKTNSVEYLLSFDTDFDSIPWIKRISKVVDIPAA